MRSLVLLITLLSNSLIAGPVPELASDRQFACEINQPDKDHAEITRFSTSDFPETLSGDTRKIRGAASPEWLAAVGRLVTKKSATEQEQCSITLVTDHPKKDAIIAVTAGHCVDHWYHGSNKYRIGRNEATFKSNSGKVIRRAISHVFKLEMSPADYAIVKLNSPIKKSDIKPLINAPYHYADLMDEEMFGEKFKPYATMAGYSADKGKGQKGQILTYHEKCQLNGGARGFKKGNCYSYQGASGGAVAVTVDLSELADEDWQVGRRTYFVGSIVGARGGDDGSRTMFTNTTYYTKLLDKILANH